jgi:Leucine-rich repeat (LRR) protein
MISMKAAIITYITSTIMITGMIFNGTTVVLSRPISNHSGIIELHNNNNHMDESSSPRVRQQNKRRKLLELQQGEATTTTTTTTTTIFPFIDSTDLTFAVDLYLEAMYSDRPTVLLADVIAVYGPIEMWDVSRVDQFNELFDFERNPLAHYLSADLGQWDVSNAITLRGMFKGAKYVNFDVSTWDVSNVQEFHGMFNNATNFQGTGLERWDVSQGRLFMIMFAETESLLDELNIQNWNPTNAEDATAMFRHSNFGTSNWSDLCSWSSYLPSSTVTDYMFYGSDCIDSKDPLLNVTGFSLCRPCGILVSPAQQSMTISPVFRNSLKEFVLVNDLDRNGKLEIPDSLSVSSAPGNKALAWLTQEVMGSTSSSTSTLFEWSRKLLQRYALLSVYFGLQDSSSNTVGVREIELSKIVQLQGYNYIKGFSQFDVDECDWEGITCNDEGFITTITLIGVSLKGGIVPEIGFLAQLQHLDLSSNYLVGDIGFVGLVKNLEYLNLSSNSLTGNIISVGSLPKLSHLNLCSNSLTGTINPVGRLSRLFHLDLSSNSFIGSIPESLYTLTDLTSLFLFQNDLTGTISNNVQNWDKLRSFHLSHNHLTGSIPHEIDSDALVYFNAYDNDLTGTLPGTLHVPSCVYFDVGRNGLWGNLPSVSNYGALLSMRILHFDNNAFTGTVPETYNNYVGNGNLESLGIDHNLLTGYVPGRRDVTDKLVQYTLDHNYFNEVDEDNCDLSVFKYGELVELRTDCNVCPCEVCEPTCAS